jgi:hypothetical protein
MFHTELLEPLAHFLPAIAVTLGLVVLWMVVRAIRRRSLNRNRAQRRRGNIAYLKIWDALFGGSKALRLTHQPRKTD